MTEWSLRGDSPPRRFLPMCPPFLPSCITYDEGTASESSVCSGTGLVCCQEKKPSRHDYIVFHLEDAKPRRKARSLWMGPPPANCRHAWSIGGREKKGVPSFCRLSIRRRRSRGMNGAEGGLFRPFPDQTSPVPVSLILGERKTTKRRGRRRRPLFPSLTLSLCLFLSLTHSPSSPHWPGGRLPPSPLT